MGWRATAACHRLAADYGGVAGPRGGVLLLVQLWSAGHESGGALHGDLHLDVTCAPLGRVRGRGRGIGVGLGEGVGVGVGLRVGVGVT